MGPQTFKALLFGLTDREEEVRSATADAILNCFRIEDIIEEYKNYKNQIISIKS
jgi:hypothetical protein